MSTRERALNIINMMSEEQLVSFVCIFECVVSDIPNEETIQAMEETEALLKDPNAMKFDSVEALFEELQS